MKSMKKVFIGLAAVAAVGVAALCFSRPKAPVILSENVKAFSFEYCVYDPPGSCYLPLGDGDFFEAWDFWIQGSPDVMDYIGLKR